MENENISNVTKDNLDIEDGRQYRFSPPSIVHTPIRFVNFGIKSDHAVSQEFLTDSIFHFSPPKNLFKHHDVTAVQNLDNENVSRQYKPRISRNTFHAPANVFTQVLKGASAFEQLKKNSKSQQQNYNTENSITCTMVPKSLLDKTVAKQYFSTFGDVLKIDVRLKKQTIVVFYVTKSEASIAYYKCGTFSNETFNVQWTNEIPKASIKMVESNSSSVLRILQEKDDFKDELEALKNLEYTLPDETINVVKQQINTTKSKGTKIKEVKYDKTQSRLEKIGPVKFEKPEFENQIVASIPKATIEELHFVIRQAAITTEDKYKILEARDRLMRLRHAKSVTLATAQSTRGTCPDMCPEKERLLREAQRQVSFYEQQDNSGLKINHMTAVKQYSRSSADQEEPMPHDLRPVTSLKMTMSYLLHEIVDLCEKKDTNLAEWYHFLWDRMRGIRKDITQQELCCPDSVELVEQCARFHIFCSERLCTEESNVFDKKINTENLTKCLQTLKYMYHDLRLKGISCPNEPEFRAYIILLNLNNGSFMSDLQRLPSLVQKSSEVKFAIEVYASIVANNYVKFFKLVRKTTYLNSSILLRYFNQVRVTALSVMVKAYCRTISKPYPYPLYELIDILAFDDEKEAIYFCEQIGLSLSQDEFHILLNREHFSLSEHNIEQSRAFNVIECKRRRSNLSAAQCIGGRTLLKQLYKNHQPHDSFNSQGYLLEESISAEDQRVVLETKNDPYEFSDENEQFLREDALKTMKSNVEKPLSSNTNKRKLESHVLTTKKCAPSINCRSNEILTNESEIEMKNTKLPPLMPNSIENLPVSTEFSQLNPHCVRHLTANVYSNSTFTKIINKDIFSGKTTESLFLKPFLPSTSVKFSDPSNQVTNFKFVTSDMIKQQQIIHLKKEGEQMKQERNAEVKINENILYDEKRKVEKLEREQKLQEIEKESVDLLNVLQMEVINDICSSIVKDEMEIINQELIENIFEVLLEDILQESCERILEEEKLIHKTLFEIKIRKENKLGVKYYKFWKSYVDKRRIKREALDSTPIWLQKQTLEECAKLLHSKQQDSVIENMCRKRSKLSQNITSRHNEVPIEVIIYAGIKENVKLFESEIGPKMFWKMTISWPNLLNKVVLYQRKKVMTKYLNNNENAMDFILKTFQPNSYEILHLCITNFEGYSNEVNLTGTDALLFIASTSEESNSIVRRLTKTVLSKNKLMPIPLVVILFHDGNMKPETVDISSDLENLMDSGYISEYSIIVENTIDENAIVKLTQSAVLWLAVNKSPQIPLEMDYLEKVLKDCLMDELWFRIQGHSIYNIQLKSALNDPQFIINLHEEAVAHLIEIILDHESLMYTNFSPEMKLYLKENVKLPCSYEHFDDGWKNVEYREKIETFVRQLMLPQWRYPWPIQNRVQLKKAVRIYSQEAFSNFSHNVSMKDIIDNLFIMIDTTPNLNFFDIILLINMKKIYSMEENLKIVYNRNHIKHFQTLPWWFKSNVFVNYSFQPYIDWKIEDKITENESQNVCVTSIETVDDMILFDDCINQSMLPNNSNPVEISRTNRCSMTEMYDKIEAFKSQLESQRLKNQYLESKIRKALLEGKF